MAEASTFLSTKRYGIVTGSSKGVGLEICKQLVSNGVVVILTARDEIKGKEALQKIKECGFDDDNALFFHQLDVTDPTSIASLVHFVNTQFGKLDILVNNAGISGAITDFNALKAAMASGKVDMPSGKSTEEINWKEISKQPRKLAEECVKTNYYGPKAIIEAFLPLLQQSDSPRIVNITSSAGQLKNIRNVWAKEVLSDAENLTQDKIEEVLNAFLKDTKDGSLEDWHPCFAAYVISKAALNAYTRVMAKKHSSICINSVCPGYVKTDINDNTGYLSVEEGAQSPVKLALMPHGESSGLFYVRQQVSPV